MVKHFIHIGLSGLIDRVNVVATGECMQIAIRTIGNNKGVVLPKPLLAQAGLDNQVLADISVENGAIVLRKPVKAPREGWAEAAADLATKDGAALLMGEFVNLADTELIW